MFLINQMAIYSNTRDYKTLITLISKGVSMGLRVSRETRKKSTLSRENSKKRNREP